MTTEPTKLPGMCSTVLTMKSNKMFKTRRKKKVLCRGVTAWNIHICALSWSTVFIGFFLVQLGSTVSDFMQSTEMVVSHSTFAVRKENVTTEVSVRHSGLARDLQVTTVVPEVSVRHAGLARDLQVTTVVPKGDLKIGGIVRLNISWLHPIGGFPPYDYTVLVTSYNASGKSHCRSNICEEYNINGTWTLIPPVLFAAEGACRITLGCSYTVNLTSNPSNGKDRLTKNISLTKCVMESKGDKLCFCDNSSIKAPSVYARVSNNTAIVTWWHNSSRGVDLPVSYYNVSLGAPVIFNKVSLPWANHDEILTVKASGSGQFSREFKTKITPGIPYLIRVVAVYTDACVGPVAQFHLKVPEDFPPKNKMDLKWIVGILLSSCLVCFLVYWIRGCRPHNRLKQFLAARTAAVRAGGPAALRRQSAWPPVFMHGNECASVRADQRQTLEQSPLYIEKEIIDARKCGEADHWEVSPRRITLGREIGDGAFGRVYIAKVNLPNYQVVAVKKLKSKAAPDEVNDFLGEIEMLKLVGQHPNVVEFVGCCTLQQPYLALLEYAPGGDLHHHLKALREVWMRNMNSVTSRGSETSSYVQTPGMQAEMRDRPSIAETEYTTLGSEFGDSAACNKNFGLAGLNSENTGSSIGSDAFADSCGFSDMETGALGRGLFTPARNPTVENVLDSKTLHSYALQIARGMEHLEKKKITHRDLAARNVLIDGNGILKIADLGLSRPGVYVHRNQKQVPLRWLALEALKGSAYTSKSDVWSYAVLLWEIGTLGGLPYQAVADHQVVYYLTEGKRLDKPAAVSQELYGTMIRCWVENPEQRPTFAELVKLFENGSKQKPYVDISFLQPNYVFPPTEESFKFKSINENSEMSLEIDKLMKDNKIV